MELKDQESMIFEEILVLLRRYPELEVWRLDDEPIVELPGLQIYPEQRKIYYDQQEIELSTKEFSLLCMLVANQGRVLTYGQMYRQVWKEEPLGNENIAVGSHVRSLRQKLYAAYQKPPFVISCIRDVGYRFELDF